MPKKFKGQNSKAVEANERKAAVKKAEKEQKEKEIEDAKWEDNDRHALAKEARRKADEEKRLMAIQRKNEKKELEEKERNELTKQYGDKGQLKLTKFEIERERERELAAIRREEERKKKEELEIPLEENINQVIRDQSLRLVENGEVDSVVDARSVEEALDQISSEVDRNPEKRMRAAFTAYEAINLPIIRSENPSLKLSQAKELLWKQWQKAPENPMNH